MSTDTEWFDDLDPKVESKADYGVPAERKAAWSAADAPLHVLAANGVDIPHRDYIDSPDDARTLTTTVRWVDMYDELADDDQRRAGATNDSIVYQTYDGVEHPDREPTVVHLHQDVRESDDEDTFGSFGAAEEDTDDVVWTVVGLDDGTVDLTVVGDWGRRRSVPYAEFPEQYEPLTLADGHPKLGY